MRNLDWPLELLPKRDFLVQSRLDNRHEAAHKRLPDYQVELTNVFELSTYISGPNTCLLRMHATFN